MTLETATDAYEDEATLDIYEVLGVSRDVSPVMAQTMYWARISELRREEARGDLEARRRINELNIALQIILDPSRRAQYDDSGVITTDPDVAEIEPRKPSQLRRVAWRGGIAVLPGVAAGLLTLLMTSEPIIAVIVAVAPVLAAALISTTTEAVDRSEPLEVLELREGATPDQIDLAYQTLVGLWLARVGASPDQAVHELDRLDRAYADALEQALELHEQEEDARQHGTLRWLAGVAGHASRRSLRAAGAGGRTLAGGARWALRRPVGRVSRDAAGGVARTVGPASTKTAGRLQRVVGRGAEATARVAGDVAGSVAGGAQRAGEELAALEDQEATADQGLTVDIERRLRASIHAVAQQAVEPPPEVPEISLEGKRVRIVLDSAVGSRRIPVDDRPIRIGPSQDADIMVDAGDDADAADFEDTLIWVSGGELVLHATPGGLLCLVNGGPVTWARLDHDDVVTIGHTTFRVESDLDAA